MDRLRPMQWVVTVTDNHGQDWLFIVAASGEREALEAGRSYFRRQTPRGTYATAATAKAEERGPSVGEPRAIGIQRMNLTAHVTRAAPGAN
jgi:hypothetical protein